MTITKETFDPRGPLRRGVNLLEASAGTGKTYTITSLYLRLVAEEAVQVEEILAVTFTNAATAELTSRIRGRLGRAFGALEAATDGRDESGDDDVIKYLIETGRAAGSLGKMAERLRAAVAGFDRATISTIHGFCQRTLQQHALESSVAFEAALVEDIRPLINDLVDDFWVSRLWDADPAALSALEACGVTLDGLRRLAGLSIEHPDAEVVPVDPGAETPPDRSTVHGAVKALVEAWREGGDEAQRRVLAARAAGALNRSRFRKDWPITSAARSLTSAVINGWRDSFADKLDPFDAGHLARWTNKGHPTPQHPVFEAVAALRSELAAYLPGAREFSLSVQHALTRFARDELARRCRSRQERTFHDQLRLLRDALLSPDTGPRLIEAMQQQYRAALIDEFQDTDPVQWAIFERVFVGGADWLYLIGDPKQAIYRFRGADIQTYLKAAKTAQYHSTLGTNWRSDESYVNAQNHLFGNPAGSPFAVDGIGYPEVRSHHPDRLVVGGAALRVRFVPRTPANSDWNRMDGTWARNQIPKMVAADISRALREPAARITDPGVEPRPLRPGDIAVLVRTNMQANEVQTALGALGIPSVLHGPDSVFDTREAEELEWVLRAILEPSRTRLVKAALATELLGVRAAEVVDLDTNTKAWEGWIERLRTWHTAWSEHSFVQMYRLLTSWLIDRLLGLRDGERRMANLLHLGELLHRAAAERDLKPAGLAGWLAGQRRDPDPSAETQQLRLESDADAVEIVTVHGAKGLEYRLVWCPYLWEPSRLRKADEKHVVYRDPDNDHRPTLDIGLDQDDPEKRAHKAAVLYEIASEELRLLYVAVTRAKHQCTVYWGGFREAGTSPLYYTLHRSFGATNAQGLQSATADLARIDDNALIAQLRRLEEGSDGVMAVEIEDFAAGVRYEVTSGARAALRARDFSRTRPLDYAWRRTSFSGLTRDAPYEPHALQAAADEDIDDTSVVPIAESAEVRVPLHELPSGRMTGNFLHRVLELVDFAGVAGEPLAEVVPAELARHGLGVEWAQTVIEALALMFKAPLDGDGLTLGDIGWERRLNEMDFLFPVAGGLRGGERRVSPGDLAAVLERHGRGAALDYVGELRKLTFMPASGFMTGSIDLTFRAPTDGRWYVVDYKSNFLGPTPMDYAAPNMTAQMTHHHYFLQYHLYTVALHRYLSWRVQGYRYDQDFGGIMYLFLRGMHPDYPLGTGVFSDRPSRQLVEALSSRLDDASVPFVLTPP